MRAYRRVARVRTSTGGFCGRTPRGVSVLLDSLPIPRDSQQVSANARPNMTESQHLSLPRHTTPNRNTPPSERPFSSAIDWRREGPHFSRHHTRSRTRIYAAPLSMTGVSSPHDDDTTLDGVFYTFGRRIPGDMFPNASREEVDLSLAAAHTHASGFGLDHAGLGIGCFISGRGCCFCRCLIWVALTGFAPAASRATTETGCWGLGFLPPSDP